MTKRETLTESEKEFLKRYRSKSYHRFREILDYCAILPKLTND